MVSSAHPGSSDAVFARQSPLSKTPAAFVRGSNAPTGTSASAMANAPVSCRRWVISHAVDA